MTFAEITKRRNEAEQQLLNWAESYCHDQIGGEVFAFHAGLSCGLPMKEKEQFIKVLARAIWYERQRLINTIKETLAHLE